MEEEKKKVENETIENKEPEGKELKTGFFKKVWYSITKIEKYPDMAAEGFGKAIVYLGKIVAILAIVLCLGTIYQTHNLIQQSVEYLKNEFPEFSYKNGILNVESENEIVIPEEDFFVGEAIIDTKTEEESKINQYINSITEKGEGIIVLKDRVIIKNSAVAGTISYNYSETLKPLEINEFGKEDVINYVKSSQIISLYVSVFITIFIYSFMMYWLTTLSNAVLLSLFGYLTTWLSRIKMRYVAVFNMSVYALTLSIILNMMYVAINIFVPFNMEYFQVMYVAVAAIYLVAAILILKTEFVKKQMELMKIAEAEEIIKKQIEEKEQKEKEQKEKDDKEKEERRKKDNEETKKEKKNKNKKEKKKEELGEEPEGSNA